MEADFPDEEKFSNLEEYIEKIENKLALVEETND